MQPPKPFCRLGLCSPGWMWCYRGNIFYTGAVLPPGEKDTLQVWVAMVFWPLCKLQVVLGNAFALLGLSWGSTSPELFLQLVLGQM